MMQRAPRPKNEKPSVTIANLERENDNLAARIEHLSTSADMMRKDRDGWRNLESERRAMLDAEHRVTFELQEALRKAGPRLEEAQAKIAKLESVLCGYRQAIADVHGHGGEIK